MSESMYKGKRKFNREQLVFAVECMLCSATDALHGMLPDDCEYEDLPENAVGHLEVVLGRAGFAMSVLYAQLTNDGMGGDDALDCAGRYGRTVREFFEDVWRDKGVAYKAKAKRLHKRGGGFAYTELYPSWPDDRKAAETFVDEVFYTVRGRVLPDDTYIM